MENHLKALLIGMASGAFLMMLLYFWRASKPGFDGDSLVTGLDLIGQVGVVILSCSATRRGLVRMTVKGTMMEVPAFSADDLLERGQRIIVVNSKHSNVWVAPM